MQQALEYADILNIPFVFSSNGDGFIFHDRTGTCDKKESTLALNAFPSPQELWGKYREWKQLTPEAEEVVLQDYFNDGSGKTPRYYQTNAINATIEAIAKGQNRNFARHGHGNGQDLHCVSDHLAVVEVRSKKAHSLSSRQKRID